jgi:hypothetical protein
MRKTGRLLVALAIVFFVDVLIFGLTGLSILLNYTLGGVIIWLLLSWAVASLLPFWKT